jgi:hypothetical protein
MWLLLCPGASKEQVNSKIQGTDEHNNQQERFVQTGINLEQIEVIAGRNKKLG